MLEKLEQVEARFETVNTLLCQSDTAADPARYRDLMREFKTLTPIIEAFRAYKTALAQAAEAQAMLESEGEDAELRALAQEELSAARADAEDRQEELKRLLLPRDPNDERSVIVEIRAGTGGEEAALFAGVLFRMYSMYAERKGWRLEVLNENPTELGGWKEISFTIAGEGAYSRFKFESGVHRVQRVPETESQGRIQTSAATVAVLPEAEEVDVQINPTDLQIDTFRSGGAGGQHVNKTESAIRITHLPTGTVVECQDERSQYKNKDRAMKILRAKILEAERQKQQSAIAGERRAQVGSGDRSERIRTYNFPQSRVTDHRIGLTLYKLDAVINGDLDEIIDALVTADTAEKLKSET
ncbi:MAG: peptide chain release factor 1, partial [Clostridia bacterium]|nr:peptide chain release factor 1 [Clostridia bacterium]